MTSFDLIPDLKPVPDYVEIPGMRGYQREILQAVHDGWMDEACYRQLIVAATGSGKTVMMGGLAKMFARSKQKVLALAHTDELITQAQDKFARLTGLPTGREKAQDRASLYDDVVVGSVQTMRGFNRLQSWPRDHFGLIMVDEAHRTLAKSYMTVLDHFETARVVGVTATADRGDKQALGTFYQRIAKEYGMLEAINDGWLVRVEIQPISVKIDLTSVATKRGMDGESDLDMKVVSHRIEPFLDDIARELWLHASTRHILGFAPSVDIAKKMVEVSKRAGFKTVDWVAGEDKERTEKIAAYKRGEIQLLWNAMLLCLDLETEILTARGFVRHNELTADDLVANWNFDGSVFFEKPLEIVHRPLADGEHMVSVDSRTINLRVTQTHRMIVGCGAGGARWKKIPAVELRAGHVLPASGISEPLPMKLDYSNPIPSKRRVAANSYALRKAGLGWQESQEEAWRRENRRCGLTVKQPSELTLDECRLIGFWIADGSANRTLIRGGIEYTLVQSPTYPRIIEWIDALLKRTGFHSVRKIRDVAPRRVLWSLCRGTGGGSQQRNGVFSIEPYFKKNGTELFWGLNEAQFDALTEGYWYGDGHHGQAENGFPRSIIFNDTKRPWIELLCAIGAVRGWRCAMYHMPSKNPKHKDQWRLRMIKGATVNLSRRTKIVHEPHAPEEVWCVRTTSKNIITRRHGKVTVMGNTEGFDQDSIDALAILRPTGIRALYQQIVGRGTRPLASIIPQLDKAPDAAARREIIAASRKPHVLVLDPLWLHEKHDLAQPASLVSKNPDEIKMMTGRQGDLLTIQSEASRDLWDALRENLLKNANRRVARIDPFTFGVVVGSQELALYQPETLWDARPPTIEQLKALVEHGIEAGQVQWRGQAQKIIDVIDQRRERGLCSIRLMNWLRRHGVAAELMTQVEATKHQRRLFATGFR